MSLAAVPLAVVLTFLTLTLTTPGATQETTTPETPESNQPDNNCTFDIGNTTYYLSEGEIKSESDEVGTSFTWHLCEDGTEKSGTVSCRDTDQCANVTLGSIIDGNNTCVDCDSLYQNCPNDTETDSNNNNSNETDTDTETETESQTDASSDDTLCAGPEKGTDECWRNPAFMFTKCCNFCYMQQFVPLSENSNDTLGSRMNSGEEE